MQNALAEVFRVIARANKYIDETAPWVLAKDEAKKPRLAHVLYNLLETLRVCGTLLKPFTVSYTHLVKCQRPLSHTAQPFS